MKMNQSHNIIGQYKDALLPIIYKGLSLTEFDDNDTETESTTDDIEWTVSRASGALLVEVAGLLGDAVLTPTIQFASNQLNGTTWQENYIGMVALGSVIEGPSQEAIQREIQPAYMTIFHMLSSS